MKADIMVNYLDNTIQEPVESKYFDIDYTYGNQDGWRVAFGITAYDKNSDQRPFTDKFGTLKAYTKIWGEKDENGEFKPTYFKEHKTRQCEKDDINLDGDVNQDGYLFWKPVEEALADLKRFYPVLQCIEEENTIMGDYNSAAARMLVIKFEICVDAPGAPKYCHDKADILSWLNRKFVLTLENTKTFNKDTIEDDKVGKESRLIYNVISPQIRIDYQNYIDLTELNLSDKVMSIGTDKETHDLF